MKAQHEFKTIIEHQEYLRTYFAAMALQGILASGNKFAGATIAVDSVQIADAIIKALNESKPTENEK